MDTSVVASTPGFISLPAELRIAIYRNLIDVPKVRMDVAPQSVSRNNDNGGVIEYDNPPVDMTARLLCKSVCTEFEDEIARMRKECSITTYTDLLDVDPGYGASLTLDDEPLCQPEDMRSPYRRALVWYPRTWYGLALALAIDGSQSRPQNPWARLSFDTQHITASIKIAEARMESGTLTCNVGEPDDPRLVKPHLQKFISSAVLQLRCSNLVSVHLSLPVFTNASGNHIYSLIHDLRLIADNRYATIRAFVHADEASREMWLEWLRCVGGRVVWVLWTEGVAC